MTNDPDPCGNALTPGEQQVIADAERRIARRAMELDLAYSDGRMDEAMKDVPSVREQLRPFFDSSPFLD
jgi:hypothetical protein